MKKLLVILLLGAACFAQNKVPTCPDGSLKFLFSAVLYSVPLPAPGGPESAVYFGGIGGALKPCNLAEKLTTGNSQWFKTGPLVSGNYLQGTTTFGPGGKFFLSVDGTMLSAPGFCRTSVHCTYQAEWLNTTLEQLPTADGSYVYRTGGFLRGTYCDGPTGCTENVLAYWQNISLDLKFPLDQGEVGFGSNGLTVFLAGPL